jgi:WD40 repeat protein
MRAVDGNATEWAIAPDLAVLATGDGESTVRLWRVPTGRALGTIRIGSGQALAALAFDPGGGEIAVGTASGTIELWRLGGPKPRQVRSIVTDGASVAALAFDTSGRRLAAINGDATARVFDPRTGRRIGTAVSAGANADNPDNFAGASIISGPSQVAFGPDGRTLATLDQGSIALWDVAPSRELGTPLAGAAVSEVAFSPDGAALAIATGGGAELWRGVLWSNFTDLRNQVCGLLGRSLPRATWRQYAPGIRYQATCGGSRG